ncbi:MAG: toprim domain-containing protein, partial [Flavobacteriales bacterium]|nr:toprim domain-containing protein [Flavobacteriales bacterium]
MKGYNDVKIEQGYNNGSTYKQLKNCIIYPLKDAQGKIVSLYGRSIASTGTHYYTAGRKGLYPSYPPAETKMLILTESVIDATTLLKYTDYEVLAMYGTNGLTPEHTKAITELKKLQEIILFFDGDDAGLGANKTVSEKLNEILPNVTISKVNTPEDEDINSLVQSHEPEILNHLIENRTSIFSSTEEKELPAVAHRLNTENPEYIIYENGAIQV